MISPFVLFVFLSILFGNILTLKNLPSDNPNNFGPYEPVWTKYEMCRGPKMLNASDTGLLLVKQKKDFIGVVDFNFTTQATLEQVKIMVYSVKDNKKNLMWSYKLMDPCKHFLFAQLIESYLNAHNCVVEKAVFHVTLNFSEITKKFIGPSFFYGDYLLKAVVTSKKANILCFLLYSQFVKKSV